MRASKAEPMGDVREIFPENAYAPNYQLLTNYALKAEWPIGIFARLYRKVQFLVYNRVPGTGALNGNY